MAWVLFPGTPLTIMHIEVPLRCREGCGRIEVIDEDGVWKSTLECMIERGQVDDIEEVLSASM